jgi:hypothetical protein
MKRFRELVTDVQRQVSNDDFFDDFEELCRDDEKRKHYRSYNDALMVLDDESWNILKEKAIRHFKHERAGQRKQGFYNQLNEAFAYRYLLGRGFKHVRLIKEAKQRTPDISFVDGGIESYCEVKTVGISDDEINRRDSHKVYDLGVYMRLDEGFRRN